MALAYLAALVGFYYFRFRFSFTAGLFWLLIFTTVNFTSWYLKVFLNVSSMLVFCVISLVLIDLTYKEHSEKKRNIYFWGTCLTVGLGIQFHYSIITLLLANFFMIAFSRKLKLPHISLKTLIKGILIFLVPSLPYIIWLILRKIGINVGVPAFYVGNGDEALASVIYLSKYGVLDTWENFTLSSLHKIIFTVPFPLFAILITRLVFLFKDSSSLKAETKPLVICLIFSTLSYGLWFFSPQAIRYSMPFYISLIFINIYWLNNFLKHPIVLKTYNLTCIGLLAVLVLANHFATLNKVKVFDHFYLITFISIFIFVSLIFFGKLVTGEKKLVTVISLLLTLVLAQSQRSLYSPAMLNKQETIAFLPKQDDWSNIWDTIHYNTGWSYAEARNKIYYVGHQLEQDPALVIEGFRSNLPISDNKINPDGFIVSNRFSRFGQFKTPNPLIVLLRQNLQQEIRRGLRNGDLKIGENLSKSRMVIPYWVSDNSDLPKHFHNTGEGYLVSQDDLKLQSIEGTEGTKELSPNKYLFKWNENPDQHYFCSTGALLLIEKKGQDYTIDLKVIGATLSQTTPWVSPNWTQAWIEPYLEINCGKETINFLIASSIGFNRNYSFNLQNPIMVSNNSFIGPFERRFTFTCVKPITSISLGRQSSTVDMIRIVKKLPSKILTINLTEGRTQNKK